MSKRVTDALVVKKFSQLQNSATSRNISFEMSLKKIRTLLTAKKCYFTGIEFIEDHPLFKRSMDRVDSEDGYFDNNVVPCIAYINQLKGSISYREIYLIERGMCRHFRKQKKDIVAMRNQKAKYEPVKPTQQVTAEIKATTT
jgi:hypothetical protein